MGDGDKPHFRKWDSAGERWARSRARIPGLRAQPQWAPAGPPRVCITAPPPLSPCVQSGLWHSWWLCHYFALGALAHLQSPSTSSLLRWQSSCATNASLALLAASLPDASAQIQASFCSVLLCRWWSSIHLPGSSPLFLDFWTPDVPACLPRAFKSVPRETRWLCTLEPDPTPSHLPGLPFPKWIHVTPNSAPRVRTDVFKLALWKDTQGLLPAYGVP